VSRPLDNEVSDLAKAQIRAAEFLLAGGWLRCDTGVTRRHGLGWEAVASHRRKGPKNQGKSFQAVSGFPILSAF
jgi:hypothetical protein